MIETFERVDWQLAIRCAQKSDYTQVIAWRGLFVAVQITQTYTQYYLTDVIGGPFTVVLPGGTHITIAKSAKSAISVLNMLTQAIQLPLSPVGGWLADRYARPKLLGSEYLRQRQEHTYL